MTRVLTYNVHGFVGTDRRSDPDRVAAAIGETGARVVALQEVRYAPRADGRHALARVAERLGMQAFFQPTAMFAGDYFGLAVLTDLPARLVKSGPLPRLGPPMPERRSALWVEVDTQAGPLGVVCAHLAVLSARDRFAQAQALVGPDWLGGASGPAILMGDLNAGVRSACHRVLAARLACARAVCADRQATFPSWMPLTRIDHVLATPGVRFLAAQAVRTPLTRVASDHLPFLAEAEILASARPAAAADAEAAR